MSLFLLQEKQGIVGFGVPPTEMNDRPCAKTPLEISAETPKEYAEHHPHLLGIASETGALATANALADTND